MHILQYLFTNVKLIWKESVLYDIFHKFNRSLLK